MQYIIEKSRKDWEIRLEKFSKKIKRLKIFYINRDLNFKCSQTIKNIKIIILIIPLLKCNSLMDKIIDLIVDNTKIYILFRLIHLSEKSKVVLIRIN